MRTTHFPCYLLTATLTHTIENKSVKQTILEAIPIAGLPGYENRLVKLRFASGAQGSLHTHSVPAIGYMIQREHESQWEDSEIEYYKAGDTFIDRADEKHVILRIQAKRRH